MISSISHSKSFFISIISLWHFILHLVWFLLYRCRNIIGIYCGFALLTLYFSLFCHTILSSSIYYYSSFLFLPFLVVSILLFTTRFWFANVFNYYFLYLFSIFFCFFSLSQTFFCFLLHHLLSLHIIFYLIYFF